jgi:hypothetical protein
MTRACTLPRSFGFWPKANDAALWVSGVDQIQEFCFQYSRRFMVIHSGAAWRSYLIMHVYTTKVPFYDRKAKFLIRQNPTYIDPGSCHRCS